MGEPGLFNSSETQSFTDPGSINSSENGGLTKPGSVNLETTTNIESLNVTKLETSTDQGPLNILNHEATTELEIMNKSSTSKTDPHPVLREFPDPLDTPDNHKLGSHDDHDNFREGHNLNSQVHGLGSQDQDSELQDHNLEPQDKSLDQGNPYLVQHNRDLDQDNRDLDQHNRDFDQHDPDLDHQDQFLKLKAALEKHDLNVHPLVTGQHGHNHNGLEEEASGEVYDQLLHGNISGLLDENHQVTLSNFLSHYIATDRRWRRQGTQQNC